MEHSNRGHNQAGDVAPSTAPVRLDEGTGEGSHSVASSAAPPSAPLAARAAAPATTATPRSSAELASRVDTSAPAAAPVAAPAAAISIAAPGSRQQPSARSALLLVSELSAVPAAAKTDLGEVKASHARLVADIKQLKRVATAEPETPPHLRADPFKEVMTSFGAEAESRVETLSTQLEQAMAELAALRSFFCLGAAVKPEGLLGFFAGFIEECKRSMPPVEKPKPKPKLPPPPKPADAVPASAGMDVNEEKTASLLETSSIKFGAKISGVGEGDDAMTGLIAAIQAGKKLKVPSTLQLNTLDNVEEVSAGMEKSPGNSERKSNQPSSFTRPASTSSEGRMRSISSLLGLRPSRSSNTGPPASSAQKEAAVQKSKNLTARQAIMQRRALMLQGDGSPAVRANRCQSVANPDSAGNPSTSAVPSFDRAVSADSVVRDPGASHPPPPPDAPMPPRPKPRQPNVDAAAAQERKPAARRESIRL